MSGPLLYASHSPGLMEFKDLPKVADEMAGRKFTFKCDGSETFPTSKEHREHV